MSRPDSTTRSARFGWRSLGTLPFVVAALALMNGVQMLLIAFGNITDFGTNQAFVEGVLGMQETNFGGKPGEGLDPDVMWHAVPSPELQNFGYVCIIIWESLAAIVLLAAFVQWVRERGGATGYASARTLTSIGLLMIVILFVGGFIVIGGEWFQMWRSTVWNGLDSALRYSLLALFPLVLVHLPSEHWKRARD